MDIKHTHRYREKTYSCQVGVREGIQLQQMQAIIYMMDKKQGPDFGVKMAEEQDGEITFSSTNSSKEQQNGEQSLQNNF